jgi:hypothetical protein
MADQLSFASLDFMAKKKRTKRDVFLAEMSAVGKRPPTTTAVTRDESAVAE